MRVIFGVVLMSVFTWVNAQICTDIGTSHSCCEVEGCIWVQCPDEDRCVSNEDMEFLTGCVDSYLCLTPFIIDVLDHPPSITPISDQTLTLPTNYVSLHANATDDNGIVSHKWTKMSGHGLSSLLIGIDSPVLRVENLEVGLYTFRLEVTDTAGLTASTEVIVFVRSDVPLEPDFPHVLKPVDPVVDRSSNSDSSNDGSSEQEPLLRCKRPLCDLASMCMYGFKKDQNGCETCDCRVPCEEISCSDGQQCDVPDCDGLECFMVQAECHDANPIACAMPLCATDCPNGYKFTELGCMTCQCEDEVPPPPANIPKPMCRMYCKYGFKTGEDGNPICSCRDPCEEIDCPIDIWGYRCIEPDCDGLECSQAHAVCHFECPMVKCVPCESNRYKVSEMGCQTCDCLTGPPVACAMSMCANQCSLGYRHTKEGCMTCDCVESPVKQTLMEHETPMIAAGIGLLCLIMLLTVVGCMLHKRRSRSYQFKHKKLENMESFRKNLILGSDWQNPELKIKDDMAVNLIENDKKPVV